MANNGLSFASGFATGFANSVSAKLAQEQKADDDTLTLNMQKIMAAKPLYNKAKAEDDGWRDTAKSVASGHKLAPEAWTNIYNDLKGGMTLNQVYTQVDGGSYAYEAPTVDPTNPSPAITIKEAPSSVSPEVPVIGDTDNQSTSLFGKVVDNVTTLFDYDKRKDKRMGQINEKTLDNLGITQDVYDQILTGYTPATVTSLASYTATADKADILTESQHVILAAQADPAWDAEDPTANIKIIKKYNEQLKGEDAPTFNNPKELAIFNLIHTENYKALKDDPEAQNEMVIALNRQFDSSGGTTTLTEGSYRLDLSKYTQMLSSPDPEKQAEATKWFTTEKPAIEASFRAVSALTKSEDDAAVFAIMYAGDDGNNLMGSATKNGDGHFVLSSGKVIPPDNVTNVTTIDMADARTKAVQAASTVYGGVSKAQISTSVAVSNLMNLDRMAYDNEAVLTTVAGGGSSLFNSANRELNSLMSLIGTMQEEDPTQSQTTLLAGINDEVSLMLSGGSITADTARAYKEFNAAVVRTIFATGKALGQSGNGFSNQDYKVISTSLVNANSYEAFSNNLRRLGTELYAGWDSVAVDAGRQALVKNVMMFPGGKEIVGDSLLRPEDYYAADLGKAQAKVYAWSKGTATPHNQTYTIDEVTKSWVDTGVPKEFMGQKVISFIEVDANGNATGTVSYERY